MCTVSDKLKLCSCETKNVKKLERYWILKRPKKSEFEMMGDMILPAPIGVEADKLNIQTLLEQLNSGNCFDIELKHQENDELELHFGFKPSEEDRQRNPYLREKDFLSYVFKFIDGQWRKDEYNPFKDSFRNIQSGKIENPF